MSGIRRSPISESSSRRHSHIQHGQLSFPSHADASRPPNVPQTDVNHPPRLKTPVFYNLPPSRSIRSNASDTDRSEIISPIPRRHLTLQRSESQHWLGSPPLSPVSTASRAVSPLSFASVSPTRSRRRASHSFSLLLDHDKRTSTSTLATIPQGIAQSGDKIEGPYSPARRWTRWMHKQGMRDWVVPLAILCTVLVRWCVGLGSYSGKGDAPMFGDYEAQRHWMELTLHLPFRQWYTYDLQYWGLDYPPLTAYTSWICGAVGHWLNPAWVALDKSRGIESLDSKIFMRSTVLAFDLLLYIPAVVMFTRSWQANRSLRTQHVAILILIFQPALLLVDFGHFQYNSVMLGLTLLAINCFGRNNDLLGAFLFVLSLCFKQMALYYAPAIGSYLIAKCLSLGPQQGAKLFVRLAIVTTISFLLLFLPWLPPFAPVPAILDPITRIFPFARGLFEDKVANFWCASNVVIKWRTWLSRDSLVKISTSLTALGFLPSAIGLIHNGYKLALSVQSSDQQEKTRYASNPSPLLSLLPYALLNSAMSFFLFSFQVHEKTILVPLLPLTLLLSGASQDSFTFQLGMLVNNVAVFSMWPLLKRDGLLIQYVALLLLWNRLAGYNPLRPGANSLLRYLSMAIYAICFALHITEALVPPPTRLPDIYPVLNVLISTPVFGFTWLWSIKRGIELGWAMGGLGTHSSLTPSSSKHRYSDDKLAPDGDGSTPQGSSTGLQDRERPANFRTRSLGYSHNRKSSLRSSSVSMEFQ